MWAHDANLLLRCQKSLLCLSIITVIFWLRSDDCKPLVFATILLLLQILILLSLKLEQILFNHHNQKFSEKQNILRVLVHDLANPLTLILSYSQLARGKLAANSKEDHFLQSIERSATEIHTTLKTIRGLEAYDSGTKKIKLEKINLLDSIHKVLNDLSLSSRQKEIGFEIICPASIFLMSNKLILENQILCNLLSNAIKFSSKKSTIKIHIEQPKAKLIKIKIIDQGIGIPQELQKTFHTGGNICSRRGTEGEKGTGFGLTIVVNFIKMLDGKLQIHSKPIEEFPSDHGTTFEITFPY